MEKANLWRSSYLNWASLWKRNLLSHWAHRNYFHLKKALPELHTVEVQKSVEGQHHFMLTLFSHFSQISYDSVQQQGGYWAPGIFVPIQDNFSHVPGLSMFVFNFIFNASSNQESFVPPVLEIISLAFLLDDASNRHLASSSYTLTPAASPLPLILTHNNSFYPQQTVFTFQAFSLSLISFPLPITSTSLSSCQPPPSLCQLTATSMAMCLLLYQPSLPFY